MTIHFFCHLREGQTNPLSHFERFLATGFRKYCGEFLTAQSSDEVRTTHRFARRIGEYRQHAVADCVTKTIIDRFEVIEVDQQDCDRTRISDVALREKRRIMQKCAAIRDTSERVDHSGGAVP